MTSLQNARCLVPCMCFTEVVQVCAHLAIATGSENRAGCGGGSRKKINTRIGGWGAARLSARWVFSRKSLLSQCLPLGHLPFSHHSCCTPPPILAWRREIQEKVKAMKSEIKENVQGTNSEGKETGTQINVLERKEEINIQPEQNEETRIQKNEERLRNLWDNFKHSNILIIGVPGGEEEEQQMGNLFEQIMKENFPNMAKEIDFWEIQEAQRVP